ncbi:CHC2 zinc finger domain-containing protein [Edaphobacter modestus]|uniref:CHC2-type zinc finger protein n=1 Tax=Edaphobacter modestus TaxID=388466 RepID=A0A4Q7Z006_9BACT|nr:CHC2 zinc finger domain-containing protein [Edaphobacter modestus]RZU43460.1 CHC2-type zinc finger protein [Edaphobacter modestus]
MKTSVTWHARRPAFNKSLLPPAASFYQREGLKLIGRGVWRSALCPFHPDRHPSLRLNVRTGAFRCFVCDARGGDVLAFHRLRTGMGFVEAAKVLGAWEGR